MIENKRQKKYLFEGRDNMKKFIAILLVLTVACGLVGCGEMNSFTIEELKSELLNENIQLDSFEVSEEDNGFTFSAKYSDELVLTGMTDAKQNIISIKFVNIGLDTSVFNNKVILTDWLDDTLNTDPMDMTMKELSLARVTLACISELQALYALICEDDPDSGLLFALNTLLFKGSTDIEGWDVKIVVNAKDATDFDEHSLTIEATHVG